MKFIGYIALVGMGAIGIITILGTYVDVSLASKCKAKNGIYSQGHCYTKTKEIPL